MIEKVRKGILISLGAAFLAKKEVERQIRVLVEAGKISRTQGKKLADKFLKEGMKQHNMIRKLVDEELGKIAKAGKRGRKKPARTKSVKRKR